MVFLGHDLITPTGGSGDGDDISGGGANPRGEGTEINGEVVDGKGELIKSVVDILKTGFDGIAGGRIQAGGVLTDIVGKRKVSGVLLAGGHIEITPVDDVGRRGKVLGQSFYRKKKGDKKENNDEF